MKLNPPQDYLLHVKDEGSYLLKNKKGLNKFSKPASSRGVAKLYTVSREGKLLYVGISQQPMSSRLNYGFKATGKNGYHGYKWKNFSQELTLTVWTASENGNYIASRDMETIEAEVAFLCRQQSDQWPEFQHEIHFYPSHEGHRKVATEIYNHAISI